jgi:hypothetical protein
LIKGLKKHIPDISCKVRQRYIGLYLSPSSSEVFAYIDLQKKCLRIGIDKDVFDSIQPKFFQRESFPKWTNSRDLVGIKLSTQQPEVFYILEACYNSRRGGMTALRRFISYRERVEGIKQKYETELNNIIKTERDAIVKRRVGQKVLRKTLLELYSDRCAMCQVDDTSVLRASHISSWSEDEVNRLNPSNAILLCGLHDLAFEKHLITINQDYTINLPKTPKGIAEILAQITYPKLKLPELQDFWPKPDFLAKHCARRNNEPDGK